MLKENSDHIDPWLLEEDEEEQRFEHYRFVADKGQSLLRIDKFLTVRIEGVSRNRIQQARKRVHLGERGTREVELQGKAARRDYRHVGLAAT